jgi:signal transduction histidine kinase
LIASQEGERKRIAAELHDSLGQNLLIIKNRAILGEQVSGDRHSAKEQFGEITEAVSQALSEVREIAYNLRPYHLDRVGLTGALEAMVEKVAESSGINFTAEVAPVDDLFPDEVELSLYRIAQECLNNIVKHSGAKAASFIVTREADEMILKISDDGRGFSPEALAADPSRRGFGLLGLAERVRLLGGDYTLRSAPGAGATTVIRLPLPDPPDLNSAVTEESMHET